jgi:hypothetical protein
MLSALVDTLSKGWSESSPTQIYASQLPEAAISSGDKCFNHSYAIWGLLGDKDKKAWRVSQLLGIDPATGVGEYSIAEGPSNADLILLDDANLGFRQHPDRWPKALQDLESNPWIVLKLSYPVAQGELLEYLTDHWASRLIAIVTADDLRLSNAQISRGLSWERIAQDTLWELSYNSDLNLLSKCAHVVVSYQTDGAVLLSHPGQDLSCQLFFDPNTIENGWSAGYKGGMVGYNTCLTASIARYLMAQREPGSSDLAALSRGACRRCASCTPKATRMAARNPKTPKSPSLTS